MSRNRRRELLILLGGTFDGVVYKDGVIAPEAGDFFKTSTSGAFIKNANSMFIVGTSSAEGCVSSSKAIDITNFSTLSIKARKNAPGNSYIGVSRSKATNHNGFVRFVSFTSASATEFQLDISDLSGSYYIQFSTAAYESGAQTYILEVILT